MLPSIWDEEKAASPEESAKYLASSWYERSPKMATFATDIGLSPWTYLSAGQTALGRTLASKGLSAVATLAEGGKASAALTAAARAAPMARSGLAPTLAGRLLAGESALQVGVPFSEKLRVPLTPLNWALGHALGPLESRLPAAKGMLEAVPLVGKPLTKATSKTAEFLFGAPPDMFRPAGQVQAQAEGRGMALAAQAQQSPRYATILEESVKASPAAQRMAFEVGDAIWRLDEEGQAVLRGRVDELLGEGARGAAGMPRGGQAVPVGGPTEKILREFGPKLAALSMEDQARVFVLSKNLVEFARETKGLAEGLGAEIPRLGGDLYLARDRAASWLSKVEARAPATARGQARQVKRLAQAQADLSRAEAR
ncbi:MAG: hypothetical protein AAB368_12100, partial [bacterium]